MTAKTKDYTEFEIQAVAYMLLMRAGYNCRGEYKWLGPKQDITTGRNRGARFDLVILDKQSDQLRLIIEVKRHLGAGEAQRKRYTSLTGAPVLLVHGMAEALDVVKSVKPYLL